MLKRLHIPSSPKGNEENKQLPNVHIIPPAEVTEESLHVWRALPAKIRKDPSWASFQIEHERLHGPLPEEQDKEEDEDEVEELQGPPEPEEDDSHIEYISMRTPELLTPDRKKSLDPFSDEHISNSGDHDHKKFDDHIPFKQPPTLRTYGKIVFFCFCWFFCAVALISRTEKTLETRQIAIPAYGHKYFVIHEAPYDDRFSLDLKGGFLVRNFKNITKNFLRVEFEIITLETSNDTTSVKKFETILPPWDVATVESDLYEKVSTHQKSAFKILEHQADELQRNPNTKLRLKMSNSINITFAFQITYDPIPVNQTVGAICGAILLIVLYALIIFEVVHRTFAAIITSCVSIGIQACLGDRPHMEDIMVWMDIETILLLFSMMILVAILTETGVFDYLAVKSYEATGGKVWPLIHCLCVITCLISAFLDNVTTVLLMTPITIRLCEVMEINPVPVLMGIIVQSNIGGTLTPIGDPPSLIIYNNHYISHHGGVNFFTFIEHMAPGVILCVIQSCLHLRIAFRDMHSLRLVEPKEIKELKREITVWQRTADSLNSYSKDIDAVRETLLQKVQLLKLKLKEIEMEGPVSTDTYKHTLEELKAAYPIKDKNLLIMSSVALLFIITLFFVQSAPGFKTLPLGWVALLGIMLLLIITDRDDMDIIMHRIEWTTLLFFAALFVTMESVTQLGLNFWIGKQTENIILWVSQEYRLAMAIFIILWVSAITSAFVETLPVTIMMVNVVVSLAEKQTLGLPIQPLVWALAFGPCLGGNGTLYGNSANVVCAGIAEQHGYKFSFNDFFKIGFPMMLGSVVVTTGYLLFAHVLFSWNNV